MNTSNEFLEEYKKLQTSTFLEHLRQGHVCVHPTDTIPGLSCDPYNAHAVQNLEQIKKRTQKKAFVGLVASFENALEHWEPLPELWKTLIPQIWPKPISFVWKARQNVPKCLVSEHGELALRFPLLNTSSDWFYNVMTQMKTPLPSTSVNYEKNPPLSDKQDISEFSKRHGLYLADLAPAEKTSLPSSVVRIKEDASMEWLREGAITKEEFQKFYSRIKHDAPSS